MLAKLITTQVWVHDQDEALAFYTEKLGFEVREDVTLEEFEGFRWLTVGPAGQPEVSLILSVPGPPPLDPDVAQRLSGMLARGELSGAGAMIFNSDDVQATYEDLTDRGVEFIQEPMERPYGIDAAFRDPSGNSFRIMQPAP